MAKDPNSETEKDKKEKDVFKVEPQPVSESDPKKKKKIITDEEGNEVGYEDPEAKQSVVTRAVPIGGSGSSNSSSRKYEKQAEELRETARQLETIDPHVALSYESAARKADSAAKRARESNLPIFSTANAAQGISRSRPRFIPAGDGAGYEVPEAQQSILASMRPRYEAALNLAEERQASGQQREVFSEPSREVMPNEFGGDMISKPDKKPFWDRLDMSVDRLQFQVERSSGLKRQGLSLLAGGASYAVGFGEGFVSAFNPKTYIDFGKFLSAPIRGETYPEIGAQLRTRPESFLPRTAGQIRGFKVGLGTAKKLSPVEYTNLDIPMRGGGSIKYRGVSVRVARRGFNVAGFQGELNLGRGFVDATAPRTGPTIGTPKLELNFADLSKGITPATAGGFKAVSRNLGRVTDAAEIAKAEQGMSLMRATETTRSRFMQDRFTNEIRSLSPSQVREVVRTARARDGTLYGSFSSQSQMPADLRRVPGDIDAFFDISSAEAGELALRLSSRLNRLPGPRTRVSQTNPSLIESEGPAGTRHAVDIHSSDTPGLDLQSTGISGGERFAGFSMSQARTRIEGVRAMRLSEQGIRKGASIYTLRTSESGQAAFLPKSYRMKDIPDFFDTQEALIRSRMFGRSRLMNRLESLRSLYPETLRSSAGAVRVELFRPEPPTRSPGTLRLSSPSIFASPRIPRSRSPSRALRPSRSPSPALTQSRSPSLRSPSLNLGSPSVSPRSPSPRPSRSPSVSLVPSFAPSRGWSPGSQSPGRSGSPGLPSLAPSPFGSGSPSPIPSPPLNPPRNPMLPSFQDNSRKGKKKGRKRAQESSRRYGYNPSLESEVFGIVGAMPSLGKIQSGLFTRPIVR
jgi:hypothetical protein